MGTGEIEAPDANRELLGRFVLRARIVRDHSLARNLKVLEVWAAHKLNLSVIVQKEDGKQSVSIDPVPLVPTEQLESAAARVRPIYLKSDGLHYTEPIASLKNIYPDNEELGEWLEADLLPQFQKADLDYKTNRPKKAPKPGAPRSNRDLAGSWIYGELLHDDSVRRAAGAPMTLGMRYESAMRVVCAQMIPVVRLLEHIENLDSLEPMGLPPGVFTDPVTVTWAANPAREINGFYVADVGTDMPASFDDDLESKGWEKNPDLQKMIRGQSDDEMS